MPNRTEINVITGEQTIVELTQAEINATAAIPLPIPTPDWDALRNRVLIGNLNPIFARLTAASLAPDANTLSTARGDIITALCVIKDEAALASALALLSIGGYTFTDQERALWQSAVDELHFSNAIYLP